MGIPSCRIPWMPIPRGTTIIINISYVYCSDSHLSLPQGGPSRKGDSLLVVLLFWQGRCSKCRIGVLYPFSQWRMNFRNDIPCQVGCSQPKTLISSAGFVNQVGFKEVLLFFLTPPRGIVGEPFRSDIPREVGCSQPKTLVLSAGSVNQVGFMEVLLFFLPPPRVIVGEPFRNDIPCEVGCSQPKTLVLFAGSLKKVGFMEVLLFFLPPP